MSSTEQVIDCGNAAATALFLRVLFRLCYGQPGCIGQFGSFTFLFDIKHFNEGWVVGIRVWLKNDKKGSLSCATKEENKWGNTRVKMAAYLREKTYTCFEGNSVVLTSRKILHIFRP